MFFFFNDTTLTGLNFDIDAFANELKNVLGRIFLTHINKLRNRILKRFYLCIFSQ